MDNQIFGTRDRKTDKARVMAFTALFILIILLNIFPGRKLEENRRENILANEENWAMADYKLGTSNKLIQQKSATKTRIVYISNSHAKAGGHVSIHLQKLLDRVEPEKFEILDMSTPGIFSPEILQRALRAMDYQPDLLILGMNYINFSDRMRLSLQSHSARSFFNKGINPRLPFGFWLRNYDINLYLNTLVSRYSIVYRNRNALRNLWEQPVTESLKHLTADNFPVRFLEIEENERWRFPTGYDDNLFQWRLYGAGREKHLADLQALMDSYHDAGIPVLGLNMPVDLDKSVYPYQEEDFHRLTESLETIFDDAIEFVNYETFFPKKFSTYDALHPTWHGARLHAFDLLLRLKNHGYIQDRIGTTVLLDAFEQSDTAISADYEQALAGDYPPPENPLGFVRYDVSEPENSREIMRQLAAAGPGTVRHHIIQTRLSRLIWFWEKTEFSVPEDHPWRYSQVWYQAVRHEMDAAKKRMAYFHQIFSNFEMDRLAHFPLPDLDNYEKVKTQIMRLGPVSVIFSGYRNDDGSRSEIISTLNGKIFSQNVIFPDGTGYYRIDILGDGSFARLIPADETVIYPEWVFENQPSSRWGI